MEGKFNIKTNEEINKHEHIILEFYDGSKLCYHDTRKFGKMHLIKKENIYKQKPLKELGLEPFSSKLNCQYLKEKYQNKKIPIKTALLDQKIVVGIGNIYANEILFLSKISPFKKASELNEKELNLIIENTKIILKKAIKDGGTTIRSYTSSHGVSGRFQQHLLVHMKENTKCLKCGTLIKKEKINGRSTYYCPKCQK